ncbi:membrane protein insertion efficiency factor YidD [Novosphingobium sp. Leaf2]|uniref:membrane protein insertion efficiency factor YidD n=1 Tax=Novosphingobium sp. Leaf2 TaxID=1735670 RepID=UPI0006FA8D34|nr:membrane protein insertion efficiency factor YidD [Novosphingobium sp. Leaf2]KQM14773.1 membrane protein insertion efficiency factor YidD [Novosphingobium sp. Leaf2]
MKRALAFVVSLPGLALIGIARLWQVGPSAIMPPTCRFTPSCSQYAIEAVRRHGAIKGGLLALWRLLRCQPWGGHGHDPVPD